MQVSIIDFLKLRATTPLVDVRSESEYAEGHVRGAHNIPLLNDQERIEVGTLYKQRGQKEAIKAGFKLVGPRLLDIINETEKIAPQKELLVHCWRGGMRSNNFCQFVGMAGIKTHSLLGGYKAYRQLGVEYFQKPMRIVLLTGCTGSGKTEIIRELKKQGEQVLDLEGLANHRGSAFGGLLLPGQPTTEQFQNELLEEMLMLNAEKRIWVEDESIAIGKIFLPQMLWNQMIQSPVVMMDVNKEVRIKRLTEEYGPSNQEEFLKSMMKITKKLGGQHFIAAKEKLLLGDMEGTIEILLTYYDKMYRNSIERKKARIKEVLSWDGKDAADFARQLINHKLYKD